jgi:diaminohydroxyphosphoribosylaminopyrimidine deaminase / 5-amino-6-(5-phosphoribosylamino)uracil reductase
MASQLELDAMRRAKALSAFGVGTTSPNPPVGCVILDHNGQIAGQGSHERKGEPHAEGHALTAAGSRAEGGTAVVTLEPCNHQGRTPACRQLLIDAKIARVVIALIDPTSRGDGGVTRLRAAGIDVEVSVLADEARLVLGPWLHAIETGRPYVTWAHVLDEDDPAGPLGHSSVSIAGHAQQLRRRADAVICDDGQVEEGVPDSHGAGILVLDPPPLSAGPAAVLASLYTGGVRIVLLNGPRHLAWPFLRAGLIDLVAAYVPDYDRQGRRQPSITNDPASYAFAPHGFTLVQVQHIGNAAFALGARTRPVSAKS